MKQSEPRRHFPLIWRAAGLLLIVLIAAIAGTTLITRAARTGADCLKVAEDTRSILIDPYAKRVVKLSAPATPAPTIPEAIRNEPYLISPDGKYVAHVIDTQDELNPLQLSIDTLDVPAINIHQQSPTVSWSPDGQWFSIMSDAPENKVYLALSDVSNSHKKIIVLDRTYEGAMFGDWSADNKYVMLLKQPRDGARFLSFWSVPELKRVDFGVGGQALLESCQTPSFDSTLGISQFNLSPHSRYFTCNAQGNNKSKVVVVDLDKSAIVAFDFFTPLVSNDSYNLKNTQWSANDIYLAVSAFTSTELSFNTRSINIINMKNQSIQEIDDIYQLNDCPECGSFPSMAWLADDETLIYARHSQYERGKLDVMLYHANSGAYEYLFSSDSIDSFDALISSNNQTVIQTFYGILGDPHSGVRLLFMNNLVSVAFPARSLYETHWSPDGAFLVVFASDQADQQYIRFFSKQGDLIYRAKVNIGIGDALGQYLTWTQCNPNV